MIVNEELVITLIVNAGEARACAMKAIQAAKKNCPEEVKKKFEAADLYLKEAHKKQTELIAKDEGKGKVQMTLILAHAQDHIMSSMLIRDLATEIVDLHTRINKINA